MVVTGRTASKLEAAIDHESRIVAPGDDWRARPDMQAWSAPFRAAMVGRGRFVEDLVADRVADGVVQYVLLGAGLDTFAQRRTDLMARVQVYEIERLRCGGAAVVASTGVSMYLTRDATVATLRQVAQLSRGSTLAMTLLLPPTLVAEGDRPGYEATMEGASRSGTPFITNQRAAGITLRSVRLVEVSASA